MAWIEAGRYRAVAGVPVAPTHAIAEVSTAFVGASKAAGYRVLFFCADEDFIAALRRSPESDFGLIPIGEQPEWDPREWEVESRMRRTVRQQCQRATNKGVMIRRLTPEEIQTPAMRTVVGNVLRRWLQSRQMSSLGFLVDLKPFHCADERRYYLATQGQHAVGFLAAVPVYARHGWFFEDIIRVPNAPNGTTELLIHTAMSDCKAADEPWVTLGLSPLAGVEQTTVRRPILVSLLTTTRRYFEPLYRFEGLRRYKARFKPSRWTTQYIIEYPKGHTVSALHAVLMAFAGGGLMSFGLDTLRRTIRRVPLRYWAITLFLLAALLIPWTILLALADGRRWFGDPSIQSAWVIFDTCLALSLGLLGWLTWRARPVARQVALFLAGTTLTDFVLTAVQAVNLHQDVTGGPLLFVLAGMAGPLAATLFLSGMFAAAPFPAARDGHRRSRRG